MNQRFRIALSAITAAVLVICGSVRPADAATAAEVDAAIKKAKAYLYSQLKGDNWELSKQPAWDAKLARPSVTGWQYGGVSGAAVYGLLASGENAQDPRLKPAIEFLKAAEIHGHYASAMRAQVWHFLKNEREAKLASTKDFQLLLKALISEGPGTGFYSYYTDEKGKIETPWFDRSVSQMSVLGVWACEQAGQEVPLLYWQVVDGAWKKAQKADGGWTYRDEGGNQAVSGTMTAAGIATLFITQDELMQGNGAQWSTCRGGQRNEWIEKGLAWMDKHAPGLLKNAGHYYYQLYGIERIGVASGRKYFGTTDWYKVGADELVKRQNKDGSFGTDDAIHNPKKVTDTVFSILFLVRGRAPVVMNKLEYDIAAEEGKKAPAVNDPWNQRPRDVANFAHWAGKMTEEWLNWQVVNLKVSAADLHDAPILYISGSLPLKFTADEIKKLRQFAEGGGIILGNADCGNANFSKSFAELGRELFPKYEMREIPKSHTIYEQQFKPNRWKIQPKLMGMTNGSRELMLLVPDADLGKWWQLRSEKTKTEAYELMEDIFLYAVDKKGLQVRGETYVVSKDAKVQPAKTLSLARIMAGDNPDPEPGGWRRLAAVVHNQAKVELKVESVTLGEGKLAGHQLAHLTGTTKIKLSEAGKAELKAYVQKGGTLLVDAAGGSADFGDTITAELASTFGVANAAEFGQVLPPEHPMYAFGGKPIEKFSYRSYVRGKAAGTLNVPRIRAHLIDGRPAVLISREDLSTGLVGQQVDGIMGYSPDTATEIVRTIVAYVAGKSGSAVAKADDPKPATTDKPAKPATEKPKPTTEKPAKPKPKPTLTTETKK